MRSKNNKNWNIMNILLCLDDFKWDYTRHCAVTILSLLETNKNNRIKIWIMSSCLSEENVAELKRIVALYNQEIEFIICDNIVPEELKKVIINKNSLTWWVRYRRFFPDFIKWIDRLLCIDCDVLVMDDISEIYNMDMNGKAIAGYLDCLPYRCMNKLFWVDNYINAGVLLFDAKKYPMKKINVNTMKEINRKYSKYFRGSDQCKINIIFKDDIFVYNKSMNYQIIGRYFNKWLSDAKIVHCLQKPFKYIQSYNCPKKIVKLYYHYLDLTKWKWYPIKRNARRKLKDACYLMYISCYFFCFNFLIWLFWDKIIEKLVSFIWEFENYKSLEINK